MPTRSSLLFALALFAVHEPAVRGEENATPHPVSVQELSLLLRSGYTGDETLKETAGRPLLAPIDAAAEHALLDAGADARTVAALRDGRRVVSPTEADDARQLQTASDQHRLDAWEAEQARRMETNRAATQTKLAARRAEELARLAGALRDKLVVCKDDRLEPYDNATLTGKKLFLFYTAAATDKASRQLTPQLADFYRKFAPSHPEFECVLLSADRAAADMEKSMRVESMPWPALAWEQIAKQPDLAAMRNDGLPRLVLIDGSGRRLADNFENGKYVGSQRVIDALKSQFGPAIAPTAAR